MLKDLFKVARQQKISLKARVDEFLAQQARDLASGKQQEKDIKVAEAEIEYSLANIKRHRWAKRDNDSRKHFLHPSSIMGCARSFCYKFMDAPVYAKAAGSVEDSARTMRIFGNGDYFHLRMQVLFVRMGLCKLNDVEVEFETGDEQGTADVIITLDGARGVVDFKSANEYSFNSIRENALDYKNEMQLRIYMEKFGVKYGILLYENKNTQLLKEIVLLRNKIKEDELDQRRDYIRHHLKRRILAEREGKTHTTIPCSRCSYAHLCYNTDKETEWRKSWSKAKLRCPAKSKRISLL